MMPTTDCNDVLPQLPLFVGGDLEPELEGGVREHLGLDDDGLAGCAACREVLESLAVSRSAILELPARSPAPRVDVWNGVRASLQAEGLIAGAPTGHVDQVGAARSTRRWRMRPVAAAAGLLLAGLALVAGLQGGETTAPLGAPEQVALDEASDAGQPKMLAQGGDELLQPAHSGGLRRLEPGESLMGSDAVPFVGGLEVVPPGMEHMLPPRGLRPVAPTLASFR